MDYESIIKDYFVIGKTYQIEMDTYASSNEVRGVECISKKNFTGVLLEKEETINENGMVDLLFELNEVDDKGQNMVIPLTFPYDEDIMEYNDSCGTFEIKFSKHLEKLLNLHLLSKTFDNVNNFKFKN